MFQRILVSVVLLSGIILALQLMEKDALRHQYKLASEHTGVATP